CRFHGDPGGSGMAGVVVVTGAGGGTGGATGGGTAGGNAGGTGGGTGGAAGEAASNTGTGQVLPQTASPLPLIGVAGAVLLGSGLWLGFRRRA
ncbi:MAG TPA: LPXTG cell wall anchor domain-containing protein, partial [Actinomycetota bacterium]|nr:LPXTG cell wall anchor domain-containing protein [Actinomycetota bacterium]